MVNLVLEYSVINGLILFSILLYRKKITESSKYFLLLYFTFLLAITEQLLISKIIARTWFTYSEFPIRFLFSTFFYLYISVYLNPQYHPRKKILFFLFLPSAIDIFGCLLFSAYAVHNHLTVEQKFGLIQNHAFYLTRSFSAIIFSLYWNIQGFKKIRNFSKRVKEVYAAIDKQQLRWLRWLSIINMILWSTWLCYLVTECFYALPRDAYWPLFILMSAIIVVQGYIVVVQPNKTFQFSIATREIKENWKEENAIQQDNSESNESLKEEEKVSEEKNETAAYWQQLFDKVEEYMDKGNAYTNKDLSLSVLSKQLKEPQTNITKAITIVYNDSFYNYVNRFRAKKFLNLLSELRSDMFTIETLSYMCGFSSRTTLYKYFKELTGLTPAAALKMIREKNVTAGSLIINTNIH